MQQDTQRNDYFLECLYISVCNLLILDKILYIVAGGALESI